MNVGADASVGADLQVRPRERAQLKQRPCRINDREVSINDYLDRDAREHAP